MNRRQPDRVERRRPAVNLNLLGEAKTRSARATRGCASLLGRIVIDMVLLDLLLVGLS